MKTGIEKIFHAIGEAIEHRTNRVVRGPSVELVLRELLGLGFKLRSPSGEALDEHIGENADRAKILLRFIKEAGHDDYQIYCDASVIELGRLHRLVAALVLKSFNDNIPPDEYAEFLATVKKTEKAEVYNMFKMLIDGRE